MVLYLDTDRNNQGWETFDFVLNKTSPTATKAYLERFTGNGYETEAVGEMDYTVNGNYMQVKVPKSMLGITGHDFTLNFTWTDNVHDLADQGAWGETDYVYTTFSGDILDFYTSGDVAPSGRFKYSYVSTAANATGTEAPTTAETDPAESVTADSEPEQQTNDAPAQQSGCKSAAAPVAALVAGMTVVCVSLKRKKRTA